MSRFGRQLFCVFVIVFYVAGFSSASFAQRSMQTKNIQHYDYKAYHFGFLLGLNKMDFALQPFDNLHSLDMTKGVHNFDTLHSVLSRPDYGFNIGILSNLKLGEQFDLRFIPTLSFGDRGISYEGVREDGSTIVRNQNIESTFLDFPLHVLYKSVRMNNTRVYVLGGFKYSHDLASAEDTDDPNAEVIARIAKNDYYYELGVGFNQYFYYFKFSTEIKASFGMRDMLRPEDTIYTNSIDKLNSKIIQLSILIE